MTKFNEIINQIELVDLDDMKFNINEQDTDDLNMNMRIYKHLKRILNVNSKYLDYVDDEAVIYISTITDDDRIAKYILILSILKAIQESCIVDTVFINDFLLTYGVPTRHGLSTLSKLCTDKKYDWHNLWVKTYTKM